MRPQPFQAGRKNIRFSQDPMGGWLGAGLGLAAVLTIAYVAYVAAWPAGAPQPANSAANSAAPSVTDGAHQGVWDFIIERDLGHAQVVPDATPQSVTDRLRLHGAGQVQTAPYVARRAARDAAVGRLPGPSGRPQAGPDASMQSVTNYLRVRGARLAQL